MPEYPYKDGDTTVLGPEIFASADEKVISWRGENYVVQQPDHHVYVHWGVYRPFMAGFACALVLVLLMLAASR